MAEGGFQEVFAADHLGDGHGGVVGYYGQLIGGDVVFAPDEEIAEVAGGGGGLGAEAGVVEVDLLAVGDFEAPVEAGGIGEGGGVGEAVAAGAGVEGLVVDGVVVLRLFAVGGGKGIEDIAAGTSAGVDVAGVAKGAPDGEVIALALEVGGVRAADVGALVPINAEPVEIGGDGGEELGAAAGGIEVLDAEDECAGGGLCTLVGGPECEGVAEVKVAGGGRGDAATICGGGGHGTVDARGEMD